MIVLDASAVVELLLDRPGAAAVREEAVAATSLHAPDLLDVEVLHVVRRWTLAGALAVDHAEAALRVLHDVPVVRHPPIELLGRAWDWRDGLSAYDGVYVALAEVLGAPLVTADARLARAAAPLVDVRVVG